MKITKKFLMDIIKEETNKLLRELDLSNPIDTGHYGNINTALKNKDEKKIDAAIAAAKDQARTEGVIAAMIFGAKAAAALYTKAASALSAAFVSHSERKAAQAATNQLVTIAKDLAPYKGQGPAAGRHIYDTLLQARDTVINIIKLGPRATSTLLDDALLAKQRAFMHWPSFDIMAGFIRPIMTSVSPTKPLSKTQWEAILKVLDGALKQAKRQL